ncbi:MAG: hypothetical protein WCK86_23375 [Planctomycetia bacterium]
MSKRDIRLQAECWVDHPQQLLIEIRRLNSELRSHGTEQSAGAGASRGRVLRLTTDKASGILAFMEPLEAAINEFRRMTSECPLDCRLVIDFLNRLRDADETGAIDLPMTHLEELQTNVDEFERWSRFQLRQLKTPLRSDLLKTSIELSGDEVLVLTDGDGSLTLRGSSTVPMFLAFWRAPEHRLGQQAFLDIDRATTPFSMERHSTRLCSKLQGVLLEVVKAGTGYQLRKCPRK